jgi:3-isopropylmalate dehydratase small subunit
MKQFGGPAICIERSDINTDEIIPAKYLTEITKKALAPHLLEDLFLEDRKFDPHSPEMRNARVVITRSNFGCGSSREHAVWALEVNDINMVVAESFARIFRQNMFNCGILAVELNTTDLDRIFTLKGQVTVAVDLEREKLTASGEDATVECSFTLNPFDKRLIGAGGWLAFANAHY